MVSTPPPRCSGKCPNMFGAAPGRIDTRLFKQKRGNRDQINNYLHISSVIFSV
jgi:hypothetical protein